MSNRIVGLIVCTLLCAGTAFAKTATWTGGGDGTSWLDANNWDAAPADGDSFAITSGSSPIAINLGAAAVSGVSLTVSGSGKVTLTGTGAFTVQHVSVTTAATDLDVPVTLKDGGNNVKCEGTSLHFLKSVTSIGTKNIVFNSNQVVNSHVYFDDTFTGAGTSFIMQFGNSGSSSNATIQFMKKVIAKAIRFNGGYRSCWCYLRASGNEIEAVEICYGAIHFYATNALPATTCLKWNGYYYENNETLYAYDFHGFDQTVEAIRDNLHDTAGRDEGRILKSSDGPMTLTLKGQSDAKARCYVKGNISLVWDPTGNYTQEFNDKASTMTGDITVKGGTFKVSGTATFATVRKITLEENATFDLASTENAALRSAYKVIMGAGATFKIASTSTQAFFACETSAEIATGGGFDIAAGADITLANVTYNGATLPQGVYKARGSAATGTECDWVSGAGTVTVLATTANSNEVRTWTGAGDGESWTDPDNWDSHVAPFSKDTAKFLQNATITDDVLIDGERTIDVASGCTVTISGCVSGQSPINCVGAGLLVLTGDNTFSGDLMIQNSYVTARGENALSSSPLGTITVYKKNNRSAYNLTLGGVVVRKRVIVVNSDDAGNNYTCALRFEANTRNEFENCVEIQGSYLRMQTDANATCVFKGGTKPVTADFFGRSAGAEVIVTNTPITHKIYNDEQSQSSWVTYACPSNTINMWNTDHNRGLKDAIRTTVNYAFTTSTYFYFGSGGLVDLCGTTQSISRIEALTKSTSDWTPNTSGRITSVAPAKMTFNYDSAYTNSAIWQGDVAFEQAGAGTVFLTAASTSVGELVATAGTVELWPTAKWSGDLRVNGGTIRVPGPKSVQAGVNLVLGETGTLELGAGEYTFSSIVDANGDSVAPGRYAAGTATALSGIVGEGSVVSVLPPVGEAATYVWTGGAGDGLFSSVGNWDVPPDFDSMNGTYVISAQGRELTIDVPVFAKSFICTSENEGSLTFNAATADDIVTFNAGFLAVTSSVPVKKHVVFNGPVHFANGLNLQIGSPDVVNGNTTLQFNGDMKSLGMCDLVRIGYGGLYLRGRNDFSGDVVSSNGVTYVFGEDPLGGPGAFRQFPPNSSTYLYLCGATVTCDIYTYTKNDASTVKSQDSTTNRITGLISNTSGHFRIAAGNNSVIDVAGGCSLAGFYIPSTSGNGYVMVSGTPLQSGSYYWADNENATRSVLNVAENYCNGTWNIYNTLETRVDYAIKSNQKINFNYWTGSTKSFGCLDLTDTKQEVAFCSRTAVTTNAQGVVTWISQAKVTGLPGSELKLNGAEEVQTLPVFVEAASYVNAGTGVRHFRNACTSTGNLEVVSGKLVMEAPNAPFRGYDQSASTALEGGSWVGGTVRVAGGELDLNHSKAVLRYVDVAVDDGGCIAIPSGVTVQCRYFYVNGQQQPLGYYSGTAGAGRNVESHLSGAGMLRSVGACVETILILR